MISLLVAMDQNRLIGRNNQLPWHLPEDLRYFKKTTMGHTIVMGRKTFESIGKPLPGRENMVMSRNRNFQPEGCVVIHSWEPVMERNSRNPDQEIFVIGGQRLFEQAIAFADRMYITEIDEQFEGDTYFPAFDPSEWQLISKTKGKKDDQNPYDYSFCVYERK
ncbi:dihydrofolate reductase [Melghiribacillus thermohalophilus]|uniref:Dihydrofolate reductase n=1 Tax=Melghiribacillus thermohalophilus TaxID=1324956 RepID=A0A4R3NE75_9BACI|nr:dihydrofolate reductase [Melghiribacillus thermohalophilus]TCT25512.1 dihydrofolate reductase [Melghiribacillus thermohalophilus]